MSFAARTAWPSMPAPPPRPGADAERDPSPAPLLHVARGLCGQLQSVFGQSADLAHADAIDRKTARRLRHWLNCLEALVRNIIAILALRLLTGAPLRPRSNSRPAGAPPRRTGPTIIQPDPDDPSSWRVVFRLFDREPSDPGLSPAPPPQPDASRSRAPVRGLSFARRIEALIRTLEDPGHASRRYMASLRRRARPVYIAPVINAPRPHHLRRGRPPGSPNPFYRPSRVARTEAARLAQLRLDRPDSS